jgi:predicted TIM-barrel fold metal-dependent hydrolase
MNQEGIDQVVVIPIMMMADLLFVKNIYAAALMTRAYNDWVWDWCAAEPGRLFPAAVLPLHDPVLATAELRRAAEKGFKLAMVRPVDVQSRYPNQTIFEPMWEAFDDTGLVTAMHSIVDLPHYATEWPSQWTPGAITHRAVRTSQMSGASQTLSFIHEAIAWMPNVLLTGFLERYPNIKMAVMESNSTWLPQVLDECDRAFHLYKNERVHKVARLPSEIFHERCFIAFEGDETPVFEQYPYYQDIGIWSSDLYHHDGADLWVALDKMQTAGVPKDVQEKLLGGNARRMYGIEPKLFVTEAPPPPSRPEWYPKPEDISREYADLAFTR